MTPTSNTRDILTSVRGKLSGLRAARTAYARRLAPEFNTLALLRPDELRLSSLVAEMLDPQGRHAQGRRFWNLFVSCFELPTWAHNPSQIQVRTEVQTDGAEWKERRIDLMVELDKKWAIAIENKPWAADQDRQVADYLTHLHVRYPMGHVLIYLSGIGNGPELSSISEDERIRAVTDGKLRIAGFSQLIPWLAACRHECEAPTVGAFLKEFEDYIRAEFLGVQDMAEREIIIQEATRNAEAVEAALEIAMAGAAIKEKLLRDLLLQLQDRMVGAGRPWSLTPESNYWERYKGFTIHLDPRDNYTVRFQFEQALHRGFFFGIKKGRDEAHLDDVRQTLDREFNCVCKYSADWTWWRDLDTPLCDWGNSTEAWQRIPDGTLADELFALIERIYQCLEQEELLPRLQMAPPQSDVIV